MEWWQGLIGSGATLAGGVAGGVGAGLVTGGLGWAQGAALGASAGGALGGLVNAAFGLSEDTPEYLGPSEEEKVILARQMDLSNQLANIEGLTPQQVSNLMSASLQQDLFTQQAVNAFQSVNRLSPLEKQILEDRLTSQRMAKQGDVRTQLVSADAGVQGQRVAQALSATGQAFGSAAAVRREERMQEQQEINFERQQLHAFDQALQAAGMTALSAGMLYDKWMENDRAPIKTNEEIARSSGVVGQMDYVDTLLDKEPTYKSGVLDDVRSLMPRQPMMSNAAIAANSGMVGGINAVGDKLPGVFTEKSLMDMLYSDLGYYVMGGL